MRAALSVVLIILATLMPAVAETVTGRGAALSGGIVEVNGVPLRLQGIDAPGIDLTCRRDGFTIPCGQQAALALRDIIGQRTVTCEMMSRDDAARMLATCRAGDIELNRWMVGAGWALADRPASEAYLAEEAAARQTRRGLWGMEFMPWPRLP